MKQKKKFIENKKWNLKLTLTVFECDGYASSKLAECAMAALGAFSTAKEDIIGVGEAAGTP